MNYDTPLVHGTLVRRYARFLADVRLDDGRLVTAHCPNPGRMTTCASPGWPVFLSAATNPRRKLQWTWEIALAGPGGTAIVVNTAVPNRVAREAVLAGAIAELTGYERIRSEVRYGERSRVDLLLEGPGRCWVEVKSATLLAEPGVAAFPDAVTARGARHLAELAARVEAGDRAVQLFVVSRGDARRVRPADEIDPAYGQALRRAVERGVEVLAYRAVVSPSEVVLGERLPVEIQALRQGQSTLSEKFPSSPVGPSTNTR